MQLALRTQDIAHFVIAHRQIALPDRVGFVLVNKLFGDRQDLLVGIQCFLRFALRAQQITNPLIGLEKRAEGT